MFFLGFWDDVGIVPYDLRRSAFNTVGAVCDRPCRTLVFRTPREGCPYNRYRTAFKAPTKKQPFGCFFTYSGNYRSSSTSLNAP